MVMIQLIRYHSNVDRAVFGKLVAAALPASLSFVQSLPTGSCFAAEKAIKYTTGGCSWTS